MISAVKSAHSGGSGGKKPVFSRSPQYRKRTGYIKINLRPFGCMIMSIEQQLIERLHTLNPTHLDVVNESSGHGGYYPGRNLILRW